VYWPGLPQWVCSQTSDRSRPAPTAFNKAPAARPASLCRALKRFDDQLDYLIPQAISVNRHGVTLQSSATIVQIRLYISSAAPVNPFLALIRNYAAVLAGPISEMRSVSGRHDVNHPWTENNTRKGLIGLCILRTRHSLGHRVSRHVHVSRGLILKNSFELFSSTLAWLDTIEAVSDKASVRL